MTAVVSIPSALHAVGVMMVAPIRPILSGPDPNPFPAVPPQPLSLTHRHSAPADDAVAPVSVPPGPRRSLGATHSLTTFRVFVAPSPASEQRLAWAGLATFPTTFDLTSRPSVGE
jgi:hypothetical protein